jgi:hypothetical protein
MSTASCHAHGRIAQTMKGLAIRSTRRGTPALEE